MSSPGSEARSPRVAASLLLLRDDPLEVLMVRRHARASFASALVFPGGAVDPGDRDPRWLDTVEGAAGLDPVDRASRIAALRETWEETAILAANAQSLPTSHHSPKSGDFRSWILASDAVLALDRIIPFGHWITPQGEPRRFDTRFYLAEAPRGANATVDGTEIVEMEWLAPHVVLERAASGDDSLLFPTLMNLERLAESSTRAGALAAARNRPVSAVEPRIVTLADGERVIRIPAEAGYRVREFPLRSARDRE